MTIPISMGTRQNAAHLWVCLRTGGIDVVIFLSAPQGARLEKKGVRCLNDTILGLLIVYEEFISSIPFSHAEFAHDIEGQLKINAYSLMLTTVRTAVPANEPVTVTGG